MVAAIMTKPPTENVAQSEELRLQGNDLYRAGKIAAAIALYEQASQLAPSSTSPWSNLAAAYYELGLYEACIKAAHAGLNLFPEADASQSKSKLAIRMAKAETLCQRSSDEVLRGAEGGQGASDQTVLRPDIIQLQQRAAQLPRFKPTMCVSRPSSTGQD